MTFTEAVFPLLGEKKNKTDELNPHVKHTGKKENPFVYAHIGGEH